MNFTTNTPGPHRRLLKPGFYAPVPTFFLLYLVVRPLNIESRLMMSRLTPKVSSCMLFGLPMLCHTFGPWLNGRGSSFVPSERSALIRVPRKALDGSGYPLVDGSGAE